MSTVDEHVVERTEGHYEVQEVEFGRVYRWCPKRVIVECECGERMTLASPMTTCVGCGTDHAALVREWLTAEQREEVDDEALHPWRQEVRDYEGEALPY